MQKVNRLFLVSLLTTLMTGGAWAMEGPAQTAKAAEYKRADTNFYPKGDVVRVHPTAIIIPIGDYTRQGDSYFFTPKKKAPREMYVETLNDWIEPITPPGATSLGMQPDAMQIREPQGDVQVALPSAPANFSPVTDGMTLPNGAVVKTGAGGTAAVLFGGVDSARLMPNSEAAVQQTVAAQSRSAEVDLTTGGVFSKVGTQVGVKGDYEVHTPFGNAGAHGGDFVTIISGSRTDVWVAQGTVYLLSDGKTDGKTVHGVTSDGTGPLKIMRFPGIADPHQSVQADVETLTAVLNFIPLANQKIKALRDKKAGGTTLTDNEQAYLKRIKQVPALIKLALVEPPAPAAPTPPPAIASAPASEAPAPPVPRPIVPLEINLRADGGVEVNGASMSLDDLKSKLADIAKANPTQPLLMTGRENVTHEQLIKVVAICHAAKLKVKVAKAPKPALPPPPTANPVPATTTAPSAPPSPAPPPAVASITTTAPAPQAPSTKEMVPVNIGLRADGDADLSGMTISLSELKWRLAKMAKANRGMSVVITGNENAPQDQLKKVLAICKAAHIKQVSVAPLASAPTPAPSAPAATAPSTPPASNLKPVSIVLHPNGTIKFKGVTMGLAEFQSKLKAAVKATPGQSFVIEAGTQVPYDKIKAILDSCADAQANNVSVDIYAEDSASEKTPPTAPTNPTPPAAASEPAPAPELPASPFPAGPAPIRAVVRVDGKVNFQGATYDLPGFKSKLEALVKATPDQSIMIRAGKTVSYEKLKAVFDCCRDANIKYVSSATAAAATPPVAPAAAEPPAVNLPTPGLLMHSPADSMSSNAPPMAPSGLPTPTPSIPGTPAGNPPTNNAPAPAGP